MIAINNHPSQSKKTPQENQTPSTKTNKKHYSDKTINKIVGITYMCQLNKPF